MILILLLTPLLLIIMELNVIHVDGLQLVDKENKAFASFVFALRVAQNYHFLGSRPSSFCRINASSWLQ